RGAVRVGRAGACGAPGVRGAEVHAGGGAGEADASDDGRCDARRAASARRSRERGRTPLFDQYEDGDRPRAANE
ncbi:hypothetical protein PV406_26650, partial [Streptomyces scabiei]|nr:hypothetical protein [Streptomyces scabiei]